MPTGTLLAHTHDAESDEKPRAKVWAAPRPPDGGDGDDTENERYSLGLGTQIRLSQPLGTNTPLDELGIALFRDGELASQQH